MTQTLPLKLAEHHLLQVLVPHLEFVWVKERSRDKGVQLSLEFDDTTEAIWRRQARELVRRSMGTPRGFQNVARALDAEIGAFFADESAEPLTIDHPPFVFRYGNGGTLPMLRMGDKEYYCLAYRDIDPIGWNLANGGSDSRFELLNPKETIARELREEVLIVDLAREIRYTLQWEDESLVDRPEFLLAKRFWEGRLGIDIGAFKEEIAPVTWIHGPDSVFVTTPNAEPRPTTGVFLNVSAADYAVEVDRVAKVHVRPGATILDGEIHGAEVVDRPVGLFDVERFAAKVEASEREFLPDVLFVSGRRVVGSEERMREEITRHCATGMRPLREKAENAYWDRCVRQHEGGRGSGRGRGSGFPLFDLCPVTRQLAARYVAREAALKRIQEPPPRPSAPGGYDVFVSASGREPDQTLGESICEHLRQSRNVFFYKDRPLGNSWLRAIEDALKEAPNLVIVCTDLEGVRWVDFEWQSFWVWKRYGIKPRGTIVPVLQGMQAADLPLPLCMMDAVTWGQHSPQNIEPHLE